MRHFLVGLLSLALLPFFMYMGITTPVSAQQCFVLDDVVKNELTDVAGVTFVVIAEPDAVKAALEMFASKGASIPAGVTRFLVYKAVGPKGELLAAEPKSINYAERQKIGKAVMRPPHSPLSSATPNSVIAGR